MLTRREEYEIVEVKRSGAKKNVHSGVPEVVVDPVPDEMSEI